MGLNDSSGWTDISNPGSGYTWASGYMQNPNDSFTPSNAESNDAFTYADFDFTVRMKNVNNSGSKSDVFLYGFYDYDEAFPRSGPFFAIWLVTYISDNYFQFQIYDRYETIQKTLKLTKYDYDDVDLGEWMWARLFKSGDNFKFKHWIDTVSEPATWDSEDTIPGLGDFTGPLFVTSRGNGDCGYDDFNFEEISIATIGFQDEVIGMNTSCYTEEGFGFKIKHFGYGGRIDSREYPVLGLSSEAEAGYEFNRTIPDTIGFQDEMLSGIAFEKIAPDTLGLGDETDVFNWSEWLRQNADRYVSRFYLTLTGDADGVEDLELPFSSFQATKRSGDYTHLSVVVPGFSQAAAIAARANGDIKIDLAYLINEVESFREEILNVDLLNIRKDEGAKKRSITLSGQRVVDYYENSVVLTDPTYKYLSNGKIRYRFLKIDPWVNPEDTVFCRSDSFRVGSVNYVFSDRFRQMEIAEV